MTASAPTCPPLKTSRTELRQPRLHPLLPSLPLLLRRLGRLRTRQHGRWRQLLSRTLPQLRDPLRSHNSRRLRSILQRQRRRRPWKRWRIMQRIPRTPRNKLATNGRIPGPHLHTLDNGQPYWDESAAYQFTSSEIDTLEAAGNTLQEMCLSAAQHIIDNKRYAELNIPAEAIPAIEWAWNNEPPSALRPLRHKLGGRPVRPRPQAPRIQRPTPPPRSSKPR